MNLKESYRYANYLDSLYLKGIAYLSNRGFVTTTTETHMRSKSNSEVADETIVTKKPFDVDFTPMDVVDFVVKIINEKECLANAIAKAKASVELNIDNSISLNKTKQQFAKVLSGMADIKASEIESTSSAYKFNNEGNQIKYYYPVKNVVTIDYNRNDVKNLSKKYMKKCDEVSSKLDEIEIVATVDFDPRWDITDSFEDLVVAN